MEEYPSFGLISEGHTDHKILKNILIGFFGESIEQSIEFLQPVDGKGAKQVETSGDTQGGWTKV